MTPPTHPITIRLSSETLQIVDHLAARIPIVTKYPIRDPNRKPTTRTEVLRKAVKIGLHFLASDLPKST